MGGDIKIYTEEEKSNKIRLMVTAIVIAEYALIGFVDDTKQELKQRVKTAIESCRKVQSWFTTHPNASPEVIEVFKQQFLSSEIVLLSELLETCFGIKENGLETIIYSIKQSVTNE